jgi:glutathione peroxidase
MLGALVLAGTGCKANEAARVADGPAPSESAATAQAQTESAAAGAQAPGSVDGAPAPSIHTLTLKRLDGSDSSLSTWAGQVLLIVNTASKCGYTPQYEGLQKLHAEYKERGFAVLGFPSNDFGGQEPGTSEEIAKFCVSIYDVNFPMFEKTVVKGPEQNPLYALLSKGHGEPKWNFHKYLIDKRGRPVAAWPSPVAPSAPEIASAIEAQLAAK